MYRILFLILNNFRFKIYEVFSLVIQIFVEKKKKLGWKKLLPTFLWIIFKKQTLEHFYIFFTRLNMRRITRISFGGQKPYQTPSARPQGSGTRHLSPFPGKLAGSVPQLVARPQIKNEKSPSAREVKAIHHWHGILTGYSSYFTPSW